MSDDKRYCLTCQEWVEPCDNYPDSHVVYRPPPNVGVPDLCGPLFDNEADAIVALKGELEQAHDLIGELSFRLYEMGFYD